MWQYIHSPTELLKYDPLLDNDNNEALTFLSCSTLCLDVGELIRERGRGEARGYIGQEGGEGGREGGQEVELNNQGHISYFIFMLCGCIK